MKMLRIKSLLAVIMAMALFACASVHAEQVFDGAALESDLIVDTEAEILSEEDPIVPGVIDAMIGGGNASAHSVAANELSRPVITSPSESSTYYENKSILFRWNAVSGADGYKYYIKQLSRTPDRGNSNEPAVNTWSGDTASTSYTLPASCVVGGYWYKFAVYVYSNDGESKWSDWIYIYVDKAATTPSQPFSLNVSSATMGVKQKLVLTASGVSNVEYSSNKPAVATVSSTGEVTAKKKGTATIKASAGGYSASCKITVKNAPKKVTASVKSKILVKGESFTLKGKLPSGTATKLTFSSSDPSVAKVDANGHVTAVGNGTVTITIKTHNGKKATCRITVRSNDLMDYLGKKLNSASKILGIKKKMYGTDGVWYKGKNCEVTGYNLSFAKAKVGSVYIYGKTKYNISGITWGMSRNEAQRIMQNQGWVLDEWDSSIATEYYEITRLNQYVTIWYENGKVIGVGGGYIVDP